MRSIRQKISNKKAKEILTIHLKNKEFTGLKLLEQKNIK